MERKSNFEKMTETPVNKLIIKLSIPTIISMMVTNIYNLVDTAFVGQLGTSASGAVGIVFGFMAILQAFGFMCGQGSGSMLSRKLGEKNPEGAGKIASTGFFLSFSLGLVLGIFSYIYLDDIIVFLGSTVTIAPYAREYILYILLASPFVVSSFTLNNILRYEGKAALGMVGLLTGGVLNIFGDYFLMLRMGMGIRGAAISTAVSQIISFFILLAMFLSGKTQCRLSFKNIVLTRDMFSNIILTGFPSLLRQALNSLTTILLNSKAGIYGDAAISAMSNVSRIMFFVFSIALGMGQGFQPVSAMNYGAGKYSRVRKAFKFTFFASEIFMMVLITLVYIKGEFFLRILRDDEEVINIGIRALRLQCIGQLFLPFCMVAEMTMQSTGRKLNAAVLSSLRGGLFFIPLLYVLSYFRGLSGIQETQPIATALSIIPSIIIANRFFNKLPKEDNREYLK